MNQGLLKSASFSLLFLSCSTFAATAIDLGQQNISILKALTSMPKSMRQNTVAQAAEIVEVNRVSDFKDTLHVRVKQNYAGYPVWGSDSIIHIPNASTQGLRSNNFMQNPLPQSTSMTGTMYGNLQSDLKISPNAVFDDSQAEKAFATALKYYEDYHHVQPIPIKKHVDKIVYVDGEQVAHWAYHVSFYFKHHATPQIPNMLIDATNFKVYEAWNEVKHLENVKGGGFGGNQKMGKLSYDGLAGHLPALDMQRDPNKKTCYLENANVKVSKNYMVQIFKSKDVTQRIFRKVFYINSEL